MLTKRVRKFFDSLQIIVIIVTLLASNLAYAGCPSCGGGGGGGGYYGGSTIGGSSGGGGGCGTCGGPIGIPRDYPYYNGYPLPVGTPPPCPVPTPEGYSVSTRYADKSYADGYNNNSSCWTEFCSWWDVTRWCNTPGVSLRRSRETIFNYPCDPCSATTKCTSYCVSNIGSDIKRDFCIYFQPCNILMLATFLTIAGISANTGLDRSIAEHWQREIYSRGTVNFFSPFKWIGGLSYWYIPLFLGVAAVGATRANTFAGNVLYNWGYRSFRTGILAIVQQIPLAYLTGSGRPCRHQPSKWQPFRHKTGVSGHAVFGAIPFLTAAYMTDPPILRFGLFVLSTLPGLSRINSNAHYFSQVLLGWGIAYLSAKAVYESDVERARACQFMLQPRYDGAMFKATYEF